MFILPERVDPRLEALVDSFLLTIASAPLVWLVIVGPLRHAANADKMAAIAQMATGVGHELRNPLTSIKLLVQANRGEDDLPDPIAEDLQVIEDEIRRMERSLQSFLDFAKPRSPHLERIDVCPLVRHVCSLVSARADMQNIELESTIPDHSLFVNADSDQIQQLLLNLLLNALDAMKCCGGGTVRVVVEDDAGQLKLSVIDSGPGIDPTIRKRLFQPFVSSKETGIGLGLVLSQRIAEDHQGQLTGENLAGGGARFRFTMPALQDYDSGRNSMQGVMEDE
jgi:signal transduction histidine kinase